MPWARYSSYFTEKFWDDHVFEGADGAKKDAERTFQRRNVGTSTMLELDHYFMVVLVGEVKSSQDSYKANPTQIFTSKETYPYWERTGKRAKRLGPSRFKYAVKLEDTVYKIHHMDGIE